MAEVCVTLTFNHLTISRQLPILLIPAMHKQLRQMELLMAISVNIYSAVSPQDSATLQRYTAASVQQHLFKMGQRYHRSK